MQTEPSRTARPLTPAQAAALQKGRKHEKPAAQERLTNLHFICPTTNKPVAYEVPSDAASVQDLWARTLCMSCPHCDDVHRFEFRSAFLEAALTANTLHELVR